METKPKRKQRVKKNIETQLLQKKTLEYFAKNKQPFIPVHRFIRRPIGNKVTQKYIDTYLQKMFEENPGYRARFDYLEWYHMFLDFTNHQVYEKIQTTK